MELLAAQNVSRILLKWGLISFLSLCPFSAFGVQFDDFQSMSGDACFQPAFKAIYSLFHSTPTVYDDKVRISDLSALIEDILSRGNCEDRASMLIAIEALGPPYAASGRLLLNDSDEYIRLLACEALLREATSQKEDLFDVVSTIDSSNPTCILSASAVSSVTRLVEIKQLSLLFRLSPDCQPIKERFLSRCNDFIEAMRCNAITMELIAANKRDSIN